MNELGVGHTTIPGVQKAQDKIEQQVQNERNFEIIYIWI